MAPQESKNSERQGKAMMSIQPCSRSECLRPTLGGLDYVARKEDSEESLGVEETWLLIGTSSAFN